jgi:GGDEF domain-containing protein
VATLLGFALIAWPPARASAAPFLRVFPYVVIVAGLALGLRFGRGRLVAALGTLVAGSIALAWYAGHPGAPPGGQLIPLLLPLNFAALVLLPEIGPVRKLLAIWAGVLAVEAISVALISAAIPHSISYGLSLPIFPFEILERIPVSQAAMLLFAASAIIISLRGIGRTEPTSRGLFWATIASFVAVAAPTQTERILYFGMGGFALVVATFEASYALAFHDDLTGLPARRAFNRQLAALDGTYVVAMVDVDHFKQFNDRHGHDVGDQVLRLVANRLAAVGGGGKGFRYGGEEFSVIFPLSSLETAQPHLEALRQNIEGTTFTLRGKDRPRKPDPTRRGRSPRRHDISVTVSIGAAAGTARTKDAQSVVKKADQALYRAKEAGRNRVVAD